MHVEPNRERISRLNLSNFKLKQEILFCPECVWQSQEPIGMSNECPSCKSKLNICRVDKELIELCNSKEITCP